MALTDILDKAVQMIEENPSVREKILSQAEGIHPNASKYISDKLIQNKMNGAQEAFGNQMHDIDAHINQTVPKSAAESASVFEAPENKQGVLVGKPKDVSPPIQSQQTMSGQQFEPFTSDAPVSPEKGLVPKSIALPETVERDVTPPTGEVPEALKAEPIEIAGKEKTPSKLSTPAKVALGAGAAAGAAYLLSPDQEEAAKAEIDKPEKKIEIASSEGEEKKSPVEEKKVGEKNTQAKEGTGPTPGEQAAQAAMLLSKEETPAAPDMLSFEKRGTDPNELEKLLNQQREDVRYAKLQQGADLLAGGIAGVKPLDSYQQDIAASGLPIEQYKLKQANEANDPNSGLSSGMRDYLKKLGVNVSPNATATQMKEVVPYIFKDIEAKQAQESKHQDVALRQEELKMRHQELNETKKQNRQDKLDRQQEKDAIQRNRDEEKAHEKFTTAYSTYRGNSAVQQAALGLKNSDAAMAIINSKPDYNQLDEQQYKTLISEVSKIATGGAATEGSIHDLQAKTLQSKAAAFWQQVRGKPTGAQLGAFVQENKDYLDHLNEINNKWVNSYKADIYRGFRRHLNPEDRKDFEEAHPEVMDVFNNQGKKTPTISMSDPADKAALAKILQQNPGLPIRDAIKALTDYKANHHQ